MYSESKRLGKLMMLKASAPMSPPPAQLGNGHGSRDPLLENGNGTATAVKGGTYFRGGDRA